jgi:hypothetical protein
MNCSFHLLRIALFFSVAPRPLDRTLEDRLMFILFSVHGLGEACCWFRNPE